MGPLVSEVEVSPEQGVNGPDPSASGHAARDSESPQHSSVADVVGATLAAARRQGCVRHPRQRQPRCHQCARPPRGAVPPCPPRDERDLHGRRLRPRHRPRRRRQRPPGPGSDQHDDRPGRGGEEPDPGARARGRDAGGGAHVELPDRSARPGRVGRRDRRPRPQRQDGRRRRRARVSAGNNRAAPGRADAADRHPAATSRPDRAIAPPAPAAKRPRAIRRSNPTSRRPPHRSANDPRSSPAAARCSPDAGADLERLGQTIGAVLATSAPANGLFAGLPYALGISGGFASPFAAKTLPQADVVLVFGASVNHWTTKHGAMIGPDATGHPDRRRPARDRPQPPRRPRHPRRRRSRHGGRTERRTQEPRPHQPGLPDPRTKPRDRQQHVAPRSLRGRLDRRVDRPPHSQHRAQRPPAKRPRGRGRLGPLPRLPRDVPRGTGRALVAVPERIPGGRARARQRDRRRDRATGPSDDCRDRRRRRVHGARRTRDRGAAEADAARDDLRRRRVRRRGPPLRADGPRRLARPVPRCRPRRDRARRRRKGRHR